MSRINAPKGFEDILPEQAVRWQALERIAHEVAACYHFGEIRSPILERSELFHRGVGETTDIVRKETFTFDDRGGDSMTLRPEWTAGVVRAAIEHNLLAAEGARAKLYYIGPVFRYERPQKGRLRQHHQFGVETFGIAEPEQDAECILLQMDFYRRCGVRDCTLLVNSMGDRDSRQRYRDVLVEFLRPRAASLSEDSQRRLVENPLRILDSKDPRDQEATKDAPPAIEALSDKSRGHFDRVVELLGRSGVPFTVQSRLVRGFDYYTETIWEVKAPGLGSQDAIGGGGRYDNLVETLGGRPSPGAGFGIGLERLLLTLEAQQATPKDARPSLAWLVAHGEAARSANWDLLGELRAAGIAADMDLSGRSVKSQFKLADREGSKWCIVVGEDELGASTVVVKDLASGQQTTIPRDRLIAELRGRTTA
jgi:histidyl-tRNA synthetase